MNCPYCNDEMQNGVVLGPASRLCWTPEEEVDDVGISRLHKTPNSIILAQTLSPFNDSRVQAQYCKSCNIIIIDLNAKSL